PGGGLLDYATRLQRFTLRVDPVTGAISRFRVNETVIFRDPVGLLTPPTATVNRPRALNGLNPLLLNNDAGALGRSFDPEGLVIDPRTGHFIVADEYGPSVYEFDRQGRLLRIFAIPGELLRHPRRLRGSDAAWPLDRPGGQPGFRGAGDFARRQQALRRVAGSAGQRRAHPEQRPERAHPSGRGLRQRS